jgi:hypothetical protein
MGEIALMFCAMSSLLGSVGGGFFMFKQEQDRKRIKDIEDNVGNAAALTVYPECDYKGKPLVTFDIVPDGEFGSISSSNFSGKSFILPPGIKMDRYTKIDNEGAKLPHKGPSYARCTEIKSLYAESGTPPT